MHIGDANLNAFFSKLTASSKACAPVPAQMGGVLRLVASSRLRVKLGFHRTLEAQNIKGAAHGAGMPEFRYFKSLTL